MKQTSYEGAIILNKRIDEKDVVKLLVKKYCKEKNARFKTFEEFFHDFYGPIPTITVMVDKYGRFNLECSGTANYQEDEVREFLELLLPYTEDGEIFYCDDNNEKWEHVYDTAAKQWAQYQLDKYEDRIEDSVDWFTGENT